ncbi:MAG: DUF87 domain-containing protein, partial [Anaerolineales bacterium]|nr:DUF87 domain-containing protein [Anaerolineales bacterium]
RLATPEGRRGAVVRSQLTQSAQYPPPVLHRLFAMDFPVWAALETYTYSNQEAVRFLRVKDASARYEKSSAGEAQAAARDTRLTVARIRDEMSRTGAALHSMRLAVLVGAESDRELVQRLEVVRGAAGIELEGWESDAGLVAEMFSPAAPRLRADGGSPLTSVGLSILAASAMSYRRRTHTEGIMLGTDMNQAPVILNLFDDRHPSYNMVVLGQTGYGKTFAILLILLRHLFLGKRIIVIDPQGNVDLSWLGAEVYHRAVIGSAGASINILDMVHDELPNQVELVMTMLAMLDVFNPHDRLERALLDEVLVDIYRPLWGQTDGTQVPTLHALQRRLELLAESAELPDIQLRAGRLAYALEPYTHGSRAALFGRPTTVDFSLSHAVTVFDVSQLPHKEQGGNLRTALLSILVADVNQAIRNRRAAGDTVQTLFFVDEIGVLMRDEIIASHVSKEFKTARSRGVSMIVADQELNSLLGSADDRGLRHGAMMLATAVTRLIFNQQSSELQLIRNTFPDLPEEMVNALPRMALGSCIAQFSDDLLMVNVEPSAFEHAILSSRLQDRARARRIIERIAQEAQGGDEPQVVQNNSGGVSPTHNGHVPEKRFDNPIQVEVA